MFRLSTLLNTPVGFHTYIWQEVLLLKETPKAILIMFNDQKHWLPKSWIAKIKRNNNDKVVKIKISEYYWSKKIS